MHNKARENKRLFLLLFAGLLAVVVGCVPDALVPDTPLNRVEVLSLRTDGGTKVSVATSGGAVTWQTGDQIAILTTSMTRTCTVDAANNKVEVQLAGGETRQGYAVYPAASVSSLSTSGVSVTYPTAYDITGDLNSEKVPIPMAAVNTSGSATLAFKQIGGILRITANVPVNTSIIKVTTTGDYMCGEVTVTNPGADNATSTISSGTNTVVFTVSDSGLESSQDVVLNLPVPCGSFSSLTIKAYNSSDTEIATYSDNISRSINYAQGLQISISTGTLKRVSVSGRPFIANGSNFTFSATARDIDNQIVSATIQWFSRNTDIATVNETTGEVTGVSVGSTAIYAIATYGNSITSSDYSIQVTPKQLFKVAINKWVIIANGNLKKSGSNYSISTNDYDRCFTSNSATWNTGTRDLFKNTEVPTSSSPKTIGDYSWYTLTKNQWNYLLDDRNASTVNGVDNARFAKAKVNGVNGLIIFPDSYTHPSSVTLPTNINSKTTAFDENTYSKTNWTAMKSAGAVFLPAAGFYNNKTKSFNYVGEYCYYMSSTTATGSYSGAYWDLRISDSTWWWNGFDQDYSSVRLVRDP